MAEGDTSWMAFAHPWVLFLEVIPALLLVRVWKQREGRVLLPFDHSPVRSGRWQTALIHVSMSFSPLLLAVAIVILAVPLRFGLPKTRRELTNIQFCVDVSGSMTARFGSGSRYDASMAAIEKFVNFREGDAFGLTFFGNQYLHWVPLTTDPSAFRYAAAFMRPERAPPGFGGTEIGKALLACRDQLLTREEGDRMIILISDGQSADLGGSRDEQVARELTAAGVTLFAVHIGDGEIPPSVASICIRTGGEAFKPQDDAALARVFERIDAMKETRIIQVRGEKVDDFRSYCIAGLALCGLIVGTSFGLRYTPW